MDKKQALYTSFLLLIAACLSLPTVKADTAQKTLPTIELKIGDVLLNTEIASSSNQRYMGLSFRSSLAENAGMLFVYGQERMLTFTMRNTLLPLSIAYLSEDLVINEILHMNVGPGQLFYSTKPAKFALEVNQGWFARNGIEAGDRIVMP